MKKNTDADLLKRAPENFFPKEKIVEIVNDPNFREKVDNLKDAGFLKNKEIFEVFKDTFNYNFTYLTFLASKNLLGNFLEKFLARMNKIVKKEVEILIDNTFSYFFPKTFKWQNELNRLFNSDTPIIFENAFYEKLKDPRISFLKSLIFMHANYYLSYILWLKKITLNFNHFVCDDYLKIQNLIKNLVDQIKDIDEDEKTKLIQVFYLQSLAIDADTLEKIEKHLEIGRIKTLHSAILKILKSPKYASQYKKEKILADQLGYLVIFPNEEQLKKVAANIQQKYCDKINISECSACKTKCVVVNKFNDRGVLNKTDDNADTLKTILPFVNVGFLLKNENEQFSLGELSLRQSFNKVLIECFEKAKDLKSLLEMLITRVDVLNHEIYKLSQEIKVLRQNFIDTNVLNEISSKVNLKRKIEDYLTAKVEKLINDIKRQLEGIFKKYNFVFPWDSELVNMIIKLVVYKILKEKLENVIIDIAWEQVVDEIKKLSDYVSLQDSEKREFLKEKSLQFRKKLSKGTGFTKKDLNKIFQEFKRKHAEVLKNANFYYFVSNEFDKLKVQLGARNDEIKNYYQTIKQGALTLTNLLAVKGDG